MHTAGYAGMRKRKDGKEMWNRLWNRLKDEDGALIVEASIVFPTMFLVIFFMIFVGNAYMQKCRIMAAVESEIRESAAKFADPLLEYVEAGSIPGYNDHVELEPYRYIGVIFSGDDAASTVENDLQEKIAALSTGLFSNMKPTVYVTDVKYKGYFIYSSVSATVVYKIRIPVRLLGASDFMSIAFADSTEIPVADAPEFIRNIDFAEDLVEKYTGDDFSGYVDKLLKKVKTFISSGD